jgi:hypothetical protein
MDFGSSCLRQNLVVCGLSTVDFLFKVKDPKDILHIHFKLIKDTLLIRIFLPTDINLIFTN